MSTVSHANSSDASLPAQAAPAVRRDVQPPLWFGLSPTAWLQIGVMTALFVWLFYLPCLRRLWAKTNPFYGEANWSHAVLIPIVGVYYLYLNRDALLAVPRKPLLGGSLTAGRFIFAAAFVVAGSIVNFCGPRFFGENGAYLASAGQGLMGLGALAALLDWGIGTLLFGLLVFAYGIYPGQNDWLKDFGMVITLFGVVLTLCGWQVMKIAWFPIAFLICALPWPLLVYSKIASPLQVLAANVAVWTLQVVGVDATCSGTKIIMGDGLVHVQRTLNVAEACAGLRSLMTFISVAAAMAFLSQRALWQKIVITLSAIPIAIFCNVMRVSGQGLLDRFVSPQLSESFAHQFVGLVMLVPAFFLILLVAWVLDQMFIEEADAPVNATAGDASSNSQVTSPVKPAGLEGRI